MKNEITTLRALVEALGGTSKAAEALGEKYPSTVSNWIRINSIPPAKYQKHKALLAGMGLKVSDRLWFATDEAAA